MKAFNNFIAQIKFPSEFARTQRSIDQRSLYKANEFKNFIFYTSIGLIDYLPDLYFNNVLKYIIFLRILCQEKLNEDDLILCQVLIEDFISEYQELYSLDNMTYNLHAHLHLVFQASKFGPINKTSAFAFEGMFKNFREMYQGTCGFAGQIVKKLQIENEYFFRQYEKVDKIKNKRILNFVNSMIKKNHSPKTIVDSNNFKSLNLTDEFDRMVKQMEKFRDKMLLTSYTLKQNRESKF